MVNKRASLLILFALLAGSAFSAESYASITYAEGSSFILVRNGKTATWPVTSDEVFGMQILPGDIIQTGPATFLELFIAPISASIQIAENTSFRCDADESGTKSTGELYYGRVRAKVSKLSGSSSYRISSPSLVAGVRGTDFGCDVIAVRPAKDASGAATSALAALSPILHRVFCFEGSVLVAEAQGSTLNTVLINKNEMVEKIVTSDPSSVAPADQVLQKKSLSPEVDAFWDARPFVEAMPAAQVPASVAAVQPTIRREGSLTVTDRMWPAGREEEQSVKKNRNLPNAAVFALIGLGSLVCVGTSIYSTQVDGDSVLLAPAYSAGFVMIGSGTVLALLSLAAD